MARKIASRQPKDVIPTIIGAGITEQNYFKHLQTLMGWKMKIRPRFFGSEDITAIEKRVESVIQEEGIAICVFDADVSAWNETFKTKLEKFKSKYQKRQDVIICDSMPSIEYWFLIHYLDTNKHYPTSASVIRELNKFITNFSKNETFHSSPTWVKEMISDDKIDLACKRAIQNENADGSYSRIYKAIELLKK